MAVESIGASSSSVSAFVKSDKLAILMDGDWVKGGSGTVSGFGVAAGSGWGDCGI